MIKNKPKLLENIKLNPRQIPKNLLACFLTLD